MTGRSLCLGALLAASLTYLPTPVDATDTIDAITAARQKINLSGRQRMLSQRMSAAICMKAVGADAEKRSAVAESARAEFDLTLAGLKDGNADLLLTPEPNLPVRQGIEVVEGTWSGFNLAIQQMLAGDYSSGLIQTVVGQNLTLLSQSNDVVSLFEKTYGAGVIDPGMATTINVAGRQRMLTQRMTKSLCFIAADFQRDASRKDLGQVVALFDTSLGMLTTGDAAAGIIAPPDAAVAAQLELVAGLWNALKPTFDAVVEGDDVTLDQLAGIAERTDTLLKEMNTAVGLYVSEGG